MAGSLLMLVAGAPSTDVALAVDANVGSAGGGSSTCTLNFNADGTITYGYITGADAAPDPNTNWFTDGTGGALRWIKMTVNSGTVTSGTTGSWLALSSIRTWTQVRSATIGIQTANVTIQIATDAAGVNVVNTWTFTYYANRTS